MPSSSGSCGKRFDSGRGAGWPRKRDAARVRRYTRSVASYDDILRVVHGRYAHVGEVVAVLKDRIEVISPAVEALIKAGVLRRLPDRRLTATKRTLGELTKMIRDRGDDPNAPLTDERENRPPLEVVAEPAPETGDGEAPRRAKCPLCKMHMAAIGGTVHCAQCGAYLRIVSAR
jgi:hypothetical protein